MFCMLYFISVLMLFELVHALVFDRPTGMVSRQANLRLSVVKDITSGDDFDNFKLLCS